MLKVGLIGVGAISGAHIPAWNQLEDTELVALCDVRPERMENYKDKNCYTDFDEMLANEDLDILDICLPTYLHADYAIKAMNKGINVICEKPISLKKEDVKRVYDAAERNNVKFMVAQVLRFWPEYEYIKKIYDTEKYGKLLSGYVKRLSCMPRTSWDNWMTDKERSGLVPYDLHIHDLDFLIYTFGAPEKITCNRANLDDQDYLNVVYNYKNFFINGEASWFRQNYPFTAGFRFQFEKALIVNENTLKVYETENDNIFNPLESDSSNGVDGYVIQSDAYKNEIEYFTSCVMNNIPCDKIKPHELEKVIEILNDL